MQVQKLMAWDHIKHVHHETPAIIGGDFNDVWSSLARRFMLPYGYQSVLRTSRTFPAIMPMRGLDAIYYRGDILLQASYVGHSLLARQASDHLPLVADFQIPASRRDN
jgi:endonuclease/exonuclease/phosphatase (EEP) superfamily protein YafD